MPEVNKSSPAIPLTGNQLFITTDEHLRIIKLCPYLILVTGKEIKQCKGESIYKFFGNGQLRGSTSPKSTPGNKPVVYVEGNIALLDGRSINTLWTVTPVFNSALTRVKEFEWSGAQIHDKQSAEGLTLNKTIHECLTDINTFKGVCGVVVFKYNADTESEIYCLRQKFEVTSTSGKARMSKALINMPGSRIPDILKSLRAGEVINSFVKDLENSWLRKTLESQDVRSLLYLPIFRIKRFWGFIGLEQCYTERLWKSAEVSHLRAVAFALSVAIDIGETIKKVKDDEHKLQPILHNSLDIVFVLSDTGLIKYVNQGVKETLGFKEQAITNKNAFDFLHPDDRSKLEQELNHLVINPAKNISLAIRVRNNKGKWIWMQARAENKFDDPAVKGIVLSMRNAKGSQPARQTLADSIEMIIGIINSITDGFVAVDKAFTIQFWNHKAEILTGISKDDIIGKNLWDQFPDLKRFTGNAGFKNAMRRKLSVSFEEYVVRLDRWFDATVYPYEEGFVIYFKDITVKKKQQMLLSIEKDVLEMSLNPDVSLRDTVTFYLRGLEKINPDIFTCVLMLNETRKQVRTLSAPRLPKEYTNVIDTIVPGPQQASCGTAMFTGARVIVADIAEDPLWSRYRRIALKYSLKACWSIPILNLDEQVLGTLAYYFKEPRAPTHHEISLMDRASNLLRLIIGNKVEGEKIRIANDRFILTDRSRYEVVWDWDVKSNDLYWGEEFYTLFGYKPNFKVNTFHFWIMHIHPEDRSKIRKSIANFISNTTSHLWLEEYRFRRADNNYATVTNKGYKIYGKKGEAVRMIGAFQDITERKQVELIKKKMDKQKSVAQEIMDAQDKERADIGKELHDNINQVLSTAKLFLEVAKTNSKERIKLIKRSSEHINHAIHEIRNISQSLVPPSIKDLGLSESIQDLVENLVFTKALEVNYTNTGDLETGISDTQKLMLFRIVQEQVNNVLKHADAKHLDIKLMVNKTEVEMTIADDGKGFDPEKIKTRKGVGLSNIASRVELFNGKAKVITSPGKGCKLIVNVARIY